MESPGARPLLSCTAVHSPPSPVTPSSKMAALSLLMVSTFQPVGDRQRKQSYWLDLTHMATPGNGKLGNVVFIFGGHMFS